MDPTPLIKSERGFALPTAMFFMLGMLAILAIGAVAAVNTQRGTVRDANSKSALAVAETGAEAALLRYGRYTTSDTSRCLDRTGVDGDAEEERFVPAEPMSASSADPVKQVPVGSEQEGWCSPVSGEVSHGGYRYWVRPMSWTQQGVDIEIVSEGWVDQANPEEPRAVRRIRMFAHADTVCDPACEPIPPTEEPPEEPEDPPEEPDSNPSTGFVGNERVVGIDWLDLSGTGTVHGAAGSNGPVTFSGSAKVCGPLRLGPDTESPVGLPMSQWVQPPEARPYVNNSGAGVCYPPGYTITSGVEEYPPVALPADIATNNSNDRLSGADPVPGDVWKRGNVSWNPTSRRLSVGYSELRLKGTAPYFLCQLVVSGSATLVADAPGQSVQIFLDRPENCGNLANPLDISGAAKLTSNGYVPGIFILGSDTKQTKATLAAGGTTYQIVLYAPRTNVDVSGDFKFNGSLIGKTLKFSGSASAVPGFDGTTFPIPVDVPEDEGDEDGGGGGDDEDVDPGDEVPPEYRLVSGKGFTRADFEECTASAIPEDQLTSPNFDCDDE